MNFLRRTVYAAKTVVSAPSDTRLLKHIDMRGRIRVPLVMISQISRSGGTLLSQLFDHHPQVWAHPQELHIGQKKWVWPDLSNVKDPSDAFSILHHPKKWNDDYARTGLYRKGGGSALPIIFEAAKQKAIFHHLCAPRPKTNREWVDAYFTSLFYSWLDYQRRYADKRYVTAFASMFALSPEAVEGFGRDYPDGYLVSIIREPFSWYASVKQRAQNVPKKSGVTYVDEIRVYDGMEGAEKAYRSNVEAIQRNLEQLGDRFILVDYEDISGSSREATMREIASWIGIDFHPTLIEQTFNGMPIEPNSSFKQNKSRNSILTDADRDRIAGQMMEAYSSIRLLRLGRTERVRDLAVD